MFQTAQKDRNAKRTEIIALSRVQVGVFLNRKPKESVIDGQKWVSGCRTRLELAGLGELVAGIGRLSPCSPLKQVPTYPRATWLMFWVCHLASCQLKLGFGMIQIELELRKVKAYFATLEIDATWPAFEATPTGQAWHLHIGTPEPTGDWIVGAYVF